MDYPSRSLGRWQSIVPLVVEPVPGESFLSLLAAAVPAFPKVRLRHPCLRVQAIGFHPWLHLVRLRCCASVLIRPPTFSKKPVANATGFFRFFFLEIPGCAIRATKRSPPHTHNRLPGVRQGPVSFIRPFKNQRLWIPACAGMTVLGWGTS